MEINSVFDPAFREYGRVLDNAQAPHIAQMMAVLEQLPITQDVVYVASEPGLEQLAAAQWLQQEIFGEMPVQLGWCNGYNRRMNAMEYHKASEVNLAATELILLLGRVQDVDEEFRYHTALAQAFLVPKGTLIEVYATTLHYAPCHTVPEGFRSLVALPKETNTPLEQARCTQGESRLLTAKNKWLIGHSEAGLPDDCFIGLVGENIYLGDI